MYRNIKCRGKTGAWSSFFHFNFYFSVKLGLEILNTIFYLLRPCCAWRMLSHQTDKTKKLWELILDRLLYNAVLSFN